MEKTEKLHHKNESNDLQNNLNGVLHALDLKKEQSFSIEAVTIHEESCEEIEEGWSPEDLFEAALCGCLKTAFLAIAKNSLLEYTSFNCTAKGTSEMNSGESVITEILLKATIEIHDELSRNKAMRIFIKAEDTCLIAHSVRSKITLEIFIHVRPILNISKSNLNLGNSLLNW
jgi:organic hydroperoxide reductase OsmC/OhrA